MRSPLRTLTGRIVRRVEDKAPVPYTGRRGALFGQYAARNDAQAQMAAMGSVGTLFAIVHRLSNATSQVGWRLWRKAESGQDEDRQEVTRHLALDIWRKPNPFMPCQEFVESSQQHLDLTGEAWWVVARNPRMRSVPLELWPVRPDRITPVPDPENFLSGYVYTSPDGEKIPLRTDEVIQLRMPNPLDPYRGMGPVQSILADLDSTRYSAEWNRAFFMNSALPSGIIEVPHEWNDTDFDTFRTRWEEQHRGVAAAHRVAIIEGGARWVERKYSMNDMQFVQLRDMSRETIREAFGMPKFAIGDVDDVNRATAEASKAWFAEMLTVPRLERIKQALNVDFLPLFGPAAEGLEFDYDDPVPPDPEARDRERDSRAEAAQRLVAAGFEPSAVLEAVGLPDMPYVGPPAGTSAPPLRNVVVSRESAAPSVRLELGPVRAQDERVERLVDQAMAAIREAFEAALGALLSAWQAISAAWRRQLTDQVRQAVEAGDVAALAALTLDTDDASGELTAAMVAVAERAAQQVVDEAAAQGVNVEPADVDEGGMGAVATVTVTLLASGLAAAAAREALRLITPDAEPGDVARQVDEHLAGLSDRPLRDELGGALHSAQQSGRMDTIEAAPDPAYWIASERNDDATCGPCGEVDDRRFSTFAAARAAYPVGGYRECLGRTRCRGTVVPIWEEAG